MKKFIAFLLLSILAFSALAKEQYVIDVLYITLRAGQGDEFQVLRSMKSGTRLEVLEVSETGYSLVRTEKGEEGWAKSKYLSDEPPSVIQVEQLQAKNDALVADNEALKKKHAQAKQKVKEAERERKRLESKSQKLQTKYAKIQDVAKRPAQLAKENEEFREKNTEMEAELVKLRQENDVSGNKTSRDWFLAGAGVLILGMVVGLILPSIRWRKRNTW